MAHQWYIIHTMSGSEKRIKQMIYDQAAKKGMTSLFEDIIVPVVEVPEIKRGKQVKLEKKFMPGYILIKMDMNDEAWHLVKNTARVTGFLGSGTKPRPVPEKEIEIIFAQLEVKAQDATQVKVYQVGENINIIDGPFESFTGTIEDVDYEKLRVRVAVSIFGRSTPMDLDFTQIKKVNSAEGVL